jgi:Uma2 family endonuclease
VVAVGVGWQLPGDRQRLRVPDLMVLADVPPGDVVTTAPLVVVEVLSTNRSDDLVRKSTEYLAAGVGQYWIVDPSDRVVDVFRHTASGWDLVARLSDDVSAATVPVPSYGAVQLSLHEVLT